MLSVEAARKLGINACIDKLGRDFVKMHRDSSTSAYGECDGGVFCFVGVDNSPERSEGNDTLILDGSSVFPYRVSCNVGLEDGRLSFIECVLPS